MQAKRIIKVLPLLGACVCQWAQSTPREADLPTGSPQ